MNIMNHEVRKILAQSEKRIRALTGNESIMLLVTKEPEPKTSFEQIEAIICDVLAISATTVRSKSRKREVVVARQLVAFYAKECCGMTYKLIGLKLGGRDHTTMMHSVKHIADLLDTGDALVTNDVKRINNKLSEFFALATPAPTNGTANKC